MKISTPAGHKIAVFRKSLGISQIELGKRLGTAAMTVSRWERDSLQPSGTMLIRLGGVVGFFSMLPDIVRYIKISSM
jgi:transcriptional regulator with XRE-family HTH domain